MMVLHSYVKLPDGINNPIEWVFRAISERMKRFHHPTAQTRAGLV